MCASPMCFIVSPLVTPFHDKLTFKFTLSTQTYCIPLSSHIVGLDTYAVGEPLITRHKLEYNLNINHASEAMCKHGESIQMGQSGFISLFALLLLLKTTDECSESETKQ